MNLDQLVSDITSLAGITREEKTRAVARMTPVVESIVRRRALDWRLDLGGNPEGIELFRGLFHQYWTIAPTTAAEYIVIFRSRWDESQEEGEA